MPAAGRTKAAKAKASPTDPSIQESLAALTGESASSQPEVDVREVTGEKEPEQSLSGALTVGLGANLSSGPKAKATSSSGPQSRRIPRKSSTT